MSVQLSREDFQKLVAIVADFPRLRDVQGRMRFVVLTLEGTERGPDIIRQIIFDGDSLNFAIQVVELLANFGRIQVEQVDKEALGIFLNQIIAYIGDDETAAYLRSLVAKYNMDKPVLPTPPLGDWRGWETEESVLEKIVGENTLRDISILQLALEAAKAVVHITLPRGYGSGFIMGPNLLMTNHHVIATPEDAGGSSFSFGYQIGLDGQPEKAEMVHARSSGLFYTHKTLDFTIVELEKVPADISPLTLKKEVPSEDSRVTIIQHPGGHYKKISMQNNFVAFASPESVQYTTSTMPGSSGSPVFNDAFEVIAIHNRGGMLRDPGSQQRYLRNAGISMVAVLNDLQAKAGEIYELTKRIP